MTKDQLRHAVTASGSHYFDPPTMRFFGSRLCCVVGKRSDGAVLFVTSEARPPTGGDRGGSRRYSVAAWTGATVDRVGAFQAHKTRRDAIRAAKGEL